MLGSGVRRSQRAERDQGCYVRLVSSQYKLLFNQCGLVLILLELSRISCGFFPGFQLSRISRGWLNARGFTEHEGAFPLTALVFISVGLL